MKLLVVLSICCVACLKVQALPVQVWNEPPTFLIETQILVLRCAKDLGPKVLNVPQFGNTQQYPEDDEAVRELLSCLWKKKGILNESGEVDAKKLEDYLVDSSSRYGKPSSKVLLRAHEIAQECKDIKDDDYHLKAVKIQNCIISKNGYRIHLQSLV